jgi:carboxypeptidase T
VAQVRVNIVGRSRQHLADVMGVHGASVVRQTLRESEDGWSVDAVTNESRLDRLASAGYQVTELDRGAPVAPEEVVREGRTPHGYLTVDEVEARLATLAEGNAGLVELIELPHRTWEGRTCHAVGIASANGAEPRPGVYLLGGIHAREWGSPDILIALVEKLVGAYTNGDGLAFGGYEFPKRDVAGIVEGCTLYVLPQANPDGRNHSLTVDPMWRKNRRPPPQPGCDGPCCGVDLNRNFDFLWDFERRFAPAAAVSDSGNPCDYELYHGPEAASEPEVRNVIWLLEEHPDIGYFVDLHSYGELILYSWGDDEDQQRDPAMNFRNPDYDGKRGATGDVYGEYLDATDRTRAIELAEGMRRSIEAARGRRYTVQQAMDLYPTAGTSDDYVYSRHLVDASLTKTISFTIEWGSAANETPFHPRYEKMATIIDEVGCGLVELCRNAHGRPGS